MTNPKDWQAGVTGRVAEAVRRFREERGMSAQDVAAACAKLGYPIARNVIANLENGRRSSVDVAEVLVLAKVLGVPPVVFLVPLGEVGEIELLPGSMHSTGDALQWVCGEQMPDHEPADDLELRFQEVRFYNETLHGLQKTIGSSEEYRRKVATARDAATREANVKLVNQFDEIIGDYSQEIQARRSTMRRRGITPPALPSELAYLDLSHHDDWGHVSEETPDASGSQPSADEEI
ncbi:helix-turn-helix domain-containing protein [Kitasatospora sp. NBC_01287]|uniref:helix-turn-helix domain-containing protein n=1 Tax=Kitasatospora sp. NBC_01287 TaxID=2903573 RepID=UPI0022570006|nr:helix-turn-helix transcriptional regulator [Kitasatospora sp. NBC_01287]MCX4748033.1 helix-turn-helix domain-containing protein [Kitasatospora sp. NBC_01287]